MKITRTRGDTYPDQFSVTMAKTGLPADITGCTFLMTLSSTSAPDAATPPVYQITGTITNPTTGMVEFSPTSTQADQVGFFYYDIQMTDANGKIRTLLLDSYAYTQDITK